MNERVARGVAGSAVLIGAITILARVAGFAKQYVFANTVGTNCLATAYFTANQIPNIVFEVVVGGALAGMVVPVLAGRSADVGRISSALLTWVLVVLVPLGALTALLAGPIIGLFFGDGVCAGGSEVATRMLVVFAPQIPLYGVAVVLYGVLQAHQRFAGPAVAPLVSSIVVIAAYLLFVPLDAGVLPGQLATPAAELALSVGTSLGVVALVVSVVGPVLGLRLRWRPTLSFPPGVAVQVRRLALAGIAGLVAQQAAMALVVFLANDVGTGAIAVYNYAWAVYLVPYAVLAVPIATSAFPGLSARASDGDVDGFALLAARTTRAVVLVSGLAAGVLAGVSSPGAIVFLGFKTDVAPAELARAVAMFAPGLIGYGLIAHLSRVLYAAGRGRAVAVGTVAAWLVVMVAQTVFVHLFPAGWKIGGMALGMTVGMTVGGVLLLASVVRARGRAAVSGLGRAAAAGVGGAVCGYLAGAGVVAGLDAEGLWGNLGATVLAGVAAVVVGALVAALVDRPDARTLVSLVLRRGGSR
ncbi:murein biosynthesis integral membrane protein MurJ [Nonomuraea sp. NPDC050556]|uniref:murein biosynthesis integral membrane protein MurJ n=1 Tax=Nonomuraea sp. NPDC050556 TaxID=3364369 RepID=UPI0037931FF2